MRRLAGRKEERAEEGTSERTKEELVIPFMLEESRLLCGIAPAGSPDNPPLFSAGRGRGQ